VGTLGLIWDDTERKDRELATHELKELAEVTLASIGDGVVTTDRCGQVRSLNRVAEHLLG
jgi:PAS domain-containing protein